MIEQGSDHQGAETTVVPRRSERVANLDGLRFIAALTVVAFHFAYRGPAANQMPALDLHSWFVSLSKYGYLGVSIFFMISGFVIAFSAEGRSPVSFGIARFTRLYPTYIAAMTVTFVVILWLGEPYMVSTVSQYIANFSMIAPAFGQPFMDGAYWSIVVELIFYFWVFVLLAAGVFHRHQMTVISIWLFIAFVFEFVWAPPMLRSVLLTEYAGFFAAGLLIYRISEGRRERAYWALLALATAHSIATTIIGLNWLELTYSDDFSPWIAGAVIIGGYALFLLAVRSPVNLLPSSLLIWMGALTYPLYLLHQHIGYLAFWKLDGLLDDTLQLALVVSLLIVASWTLWYFVERPMIPKLRRYLTRIFDRPLYLPA